MGLFDFLKGVKNNVQNSNFYDKLVNNQSNYNMAPLQKVEGANSAGVMPDGSLAKAPSVELVDIQLDNNGNMTNANTQPMKNLTRGERMVNALFGTPTGGAGEVGQLTTADDGNALISASINNNPRKGGFFNDFSAGYNENRFNPISAGNLTPNQNKNWANRLGEGIGSLARLAESPLGRSLLVGGLVGATGGSGLEALAYGASTGVQNQGNRSRDAAYRNSLESQGIDTSNLHGYLTDSTYKNILDAKTLQDNANWRKFYYENQAQQNANTLKQRQLESDRDYAYKQKSLALKEKELDKDLQGNNTLEKDLLEVKQQLDNFSSMFDRMPGKVESYTLGKIRGLTGTQTQDEANFNSQRTLLFNQIARKLGGEKGVLSDQDIKRVEAALPNLTDSKEQKDAKMKAVYDLLKIRTGQGVQQDPLGIL